MKRRIKQWKVRTGLALALAVIIALTGCNGSNKGNEASSSVEPSTTATASESASASATDTKAAPPEEVTLQFYLIHDKVPNNMQAVLDEFYNETKDTLNTKIAINFVPWATAKEKLALKLASGDQVDVVFDAQWQTMSPNISKGIYLNLDKYFNNDEYPGLKKAFGPDYIDNNKFVDGSGEKHIYGIPFTQTFGFLQGVMIRKDLREKYGLPEIKSVAELEAYFDAVLKNEKGVVPFGLNGGIPSLGNWLVPNVPPQSRLAMLAGEVLPTYSINADGTVNVVFHGEDISALAEGMNKKENFYQGEIKAREWYTKGYLEKDVISQKDPIGFFKAGKFAAIAGDTAGFVATNNELKSKVPGAEGELVFLVPGVMEGTPKSLLSDFKAWNFACIPANSKNADRVMKFFDWLNASQDNHDLFELGIKGKDWEPVGDSQYKVPDGVDIGKVYDFPGYMMTWNPTYIRTNANLPENIVHINQYLGDTNNFIKSPTSEFSLNAEPIKNELTKVGQEYKKARTIAGLGLTDDYEGAYKKMIEKAKKLGLEKIRAEIKKQLEEYLKTHPVQ
ncbi:extracellular solute-binding protein [Cohnella silvisoli]|uniref:Extracellular solute-binding protein n=1 Tax=Cohnella silvisoli TaxID=2873699 RepID=A0ABV1KNE2_9BACL|nr:extracellular solute-binding protein [Cohnella silvisoli]MCD9021107.1 extracellular solute-binding protein [Cohnella silvisoli]